MLVLVRDTRVEVLRDQVQVKGREWEACCTGSPDPEEDSCCLVHSGAPQSRHPP
jgi:hypothetical protein